MLIGRLVLWMLVREREGVVGVEREMMMMVRPDGQMMRMIETETGMEGGVGIE